MNAHHTEFKRTAAYPCSACVCTMQNERQTCIHHRHCVLEVYTQAGCTCNDHLRTIALVLILQHAYPRKVVHDGYQLITISVPFEVGRPPIPLVLCLFTGTRTCLCTWAMLRKSRIMYMYMKGTCTCMVHVCPLNKSPLCTQSSDSSLFTSGRRNKISAAHS